MPVAEPRRCEHRCDRVGHHAVHRIVYILDLAERPGSGRRRDALQHPQRHDHRHDNRTGPAHETPQPPQHRTDEHDQPRALVRRQAHRERFGLQTTELRMPQQQADQQDHRNRQHVHEEHHRSGMAAEEGVGEHQIHRQTRRAGGERDQHAGQHTLPGVGQRPGGRQRRQIAAEPYDDRQERAAVQTDRPHRAVHHERRARQIPRILQQ